MRVIRFMNISKKDTNLLILFKVLFQEKNLTRAAHRMSLSQPAMSHKLNKLRHEFSDPLFVRSGHGLAATPKAKAIANRLFALVDNLEEFYEELSKDSFLKIEDKINIYTTDYIEYLLMPSLLKVIDQFAPNLQIAIINTKGELPLNEMELGECDIAIAGFYNNLPKRLYAQHIRNDSFVVLASQSNTKISRGTLDLKGYLACKHIMTTLSGDLSSSLIDARLEKEDKKRKVISGLTSFLTPPTIIEDSDYLLTCLKPIAEMAISKSRDLVIYPPPIDIPPINVKQVWHPSTDQSSIRKWLREHINNILSNESA